MKESIFDVRQIVEFSGHIKAKDRVLEIIRKNIAYFGEKFPSGSTRKNLYIKVEKNSEWTTGFWTGLLALAYEFSNEPEFFETLEKLVPSFLDRLKDESRIQTHDLGFIYVLSIIPYLRLSKRDEMKDVVIEAADKLIRRFKRKPGFLQAWKGVDDPIEKGRVIIDSMMNLPLLYISWKITGDEKYREVAVSHARTCMKYLVRENGSTYHTYFFDTDTGDPLKPSTVQGYSDDSYWARGQAWAMYGFTLSYIYTGLEDFLKTALKTTEFFLNKLPDDFVPYWDMIFEDGSGEEKDSSAAAIAICALLELSKHVGIEKRVMFQTATYRILHNLIYFYLNWNAREGEPILLHGVHAKPLNMGINEGNIWGDYFFVEALMRVLNPVWKPYWIF